MASSLGQLAAEVVKAAAVQGLKINLAESLTGGLVAASLASVPGASAVLVSGVVAYHNAAKHQLLAVPTVTLVSFGAVSAQTAQAMAVGARGLVDNVPGIEDDKVIGLATTGVAGPDVVEGKPVGQVFVALATSGKVESLNLQLSGSREQIRVAAAEAVLGMLLEEIKA
jgi:nicotinamide-nucleotide amidase